eukprot:Sdes_comp20246_c0_seq3m13679
MENPTIVGPGKFSNKFSILTYNINWGLCRVPILTKKTGLVVEAIINSGADIVCLQETHSGWEEFLTSLLGDNFPYRIFRHHLNREATAHSLEGSYAGGLSVLSKYPLQEVFHMQPPVEGSFFPILAVQISF